VIYAGDDAPAKIEYSDEFTGYSLSYLNGVFRSMVYLESMFIIRYEILSEDFKIYIGDVLDAGDIDVEDALVYLHIVIDEGSIEKVKSLITYLPACRDVCGENEGVNIYLLSLFILSLLLISIAVYRYMGGRDAD